MPDVINEIINGLIKREGPATNDPVDRGGRTEMGISERAHPEAWKDGKVTQDEAYAIYTAKYVRAPGFDKITDEKLRIQLIDFAVMSGSFIAVQKLQETLGATADGILGPETVDALSKRDPREINNLLVVSRIKMICKIVQRNPTQIKYLLGWASRACEFFF